MSKFTYSYRYWARMVRNPGIVCVPDEVMANIADYLNRGFPFLVTRGDGSRSRAVMHLPGCFRTGQAVVKIIGG